MIGHTKTVFFRAVEAIWRIGIAKSTNVQIVADYLATVDSAEYYTANMLACKILSNSFDLLAFALSRTSLDGLICEFGVASGATINHIARTCPDRAVHGFDGFVGLPEHWRPGFEAGTFSQSVPKVESNVELHVGLFDSTLPDFVLKNPQPISFLHVDCDLYSSTKTIFSFLGDRIRPGTIIVFDEYFNYPGWREHEWLAFKEYIAAAQLRYRYIGVVPSHQQVGVIIESAPS